MNGKRWQRCRIIGVSYKRAITDMRSCMVYNIQNANFKDKHKCLNSRPIKIPCITKQDSAQEDAWNNMELTSLKLALQSWDTTHSDHMTHSRLSFSTRSEKGLELLQFTMQIAFLLFLNCSMSFSSIRFSKIIIMSSTFSAWTLPDFFLKSYISWYACFVIGLVLLLDHK